VSRHPILSKLKWASVCYGSNLLCRKQTPFRIIKHLTATRKNWVPKCWGQEFSTGGNRLSTKWLIACAYLFVKKWQWYYIPITYASPQTPWIIYNAGRRSSPKVTNYRLVRAFPISTRYWYTGHKRCNCRVKVLHLEGILGANFTSHLNFHWNNTLAIKLLLRSLLNFK
jgi:hypothetical protein